MLSSLIRQHEQYRTSGLNLIASENRLSAPAASALSSDLAGRYTGEWYGGTRHAADIVAETERLAKQVFGARYALVTPLSGNLCDLAALFSFTEHGETVAAVPKEAGGYPLGYHKFGRRLAALPTHAYRIRTEEAGDLLRRERPPLTLLGASTILFPHPVKELAREATDCGTLAYDASHVLGLIAGGQFQHPLAEGADVLLGSTHKTLPGPQGGLVVTDSAEKAEALGHMLCFDFEGGIGLVDNPHVNRIAALGVVLEEMLEHGPAYARQVIKNARALAGALHQLGLPVALAEEGFTRSHQIVLDLPRREAPELCRTLEEQHIFVDISGRLGVAEVTHVGMREEEMETIAHLVADAARGQEVAGQVQSLARRFYGGDPC